MIINTLNVVLDAHISHKVGEVSSERPIALDRQCQNIAVDLVEPIAMEMGQNQLEVKASVLGGSPQLGDLKVGGAQDVQLLGFYREPGGSIQNAQISNVEGL